MKIGYFLDKMIKSSENQIGTLNYELNNYREKISKINKELIFCDNMKYRFEKISNIITLIYSIILIIFFGLNFFSVLSSNFLITFFFSTLIIGYGGYKIIGKKIDEEAKKNRKYLIDERSTYQSNYDKCHAKIKIMRKTIEQTINARKFFEVHHHQEFLEKNLPCFEVQVLQCLEKNISLISVLYLANNNSLPNKLPSNMSYTEMQSLLNLSLDIDRKLNENPMLFFECDIKSQEKGIKESNQNINKNSNIEMPLAPPKQVKNELDSSLKSQRVRHYRSAKYRESNQENNQQSDDMGRSR